MKKVQYFASKFHGKLGYSIYFLLSMNIFVAITDGLGISLLVPILGVSENGIYEHSDNVGQSLLLFFGVPVNLHNTLLLVLLVFILKLFVVLFSTYYQSTLYRRLIVILKRGLFRSVLDAEYSYILSKDSSFYVELMNNQINLYADTFRQYIRFATALVIAISYFIIAFTFNIRLSIITLVLGAPVLVIFRYLQSFTTNSSQDSAEASHTLALISAESFQSFKYLLSTMSFSGLLKKHRGAVSDFARARFKVNFAQGITSSSKEFVAITVVMALILIQIDFLRKPIAEALVVIFIFYRALNQVMTALYQLQALVGNYGFVDSVECELDVLAENAVTNGSLDYSEEAKIELIGFNEVYFNYRESKKNTLTNINLSIKSNQMIALVGSSGAGKTTLIDLITGLLKSSGGSLTIKGVAIEDLDIEQWRKQIGYVTQDLRVFNDTILNNIVLWEKSFCLETVIEVLKESDLFEFVESLPNGINTEIGENGVMLSGGQRQRLVIARELYKKPGLFIFDEATSSLDSESEENVQKTIMKIKGRVTTIIIAHRISTVKDVDRIIVMDNGRIVEHGCYKELIADKSSRFHELAKKQMLT